MLTSNALGLGRRLCLLAVLVASLYVVGYTDMIPGAAAAGYGCQPCDNPYGVVCTSDYRCATCGQLALPLGEACPDGTYEFAYSCQYTCIDEGPGGGGNCGSAEMPFCSGSEVAVCQGGTWVCDNAPYNSCSGPGLPWCQNGSYCYGGEWRCR